MSFAYERGWRQNFAGAGFPGPEREAEIALRYMTPAHGGVLVDVSCGTGLFTRVFARSGAFSGVVALDYSESMLLQAQQYFADDPGLGARCAVAVLLRVLVLLPQQAPLTHVLLLHSHVLNADGLSPSPSPSRLPCLPHRPPAHLCPPAPIIAATRVVRPHSAPIVAVRADIGRLPFATGSVDVIHAGAAIHCWPNPQAAFAEISRVLRPGGVFVASTFLTPLAPLGELVGDDTVRPLSQV